MTESELLLSVLEKKAPLGIPWFADLSYYYAALERKGALARKYAGEAGYLQFYKDQKAGICFYCPPPFSVTYKGGIECNEKKSGDDLLLEYVTPKGTVTQISTYYPQTYTHVITKHFVENFNDLLLMEHIFENTVYHENHAEYARVRHLWRDAGEAVAIPPISVSPFQKLLARWAGVEKTIDLMCDHEDDFDAVLCAIDRSQDAVFSIIAASDARVVEFAENLSSDITGTTLYEKYNSGCYRKNIQTLHAAGKSVSIHIDGYLKGCLPLLEKDGFDIAEAVTPAPVGDVQAKDLRTLAGGSIILWGGLPGALFSSQYSDAFFMDYLQDILETFRQDGRFVLGVADQVPPDCREGRVLETGEYVRAFNKKHFQIDLT
jgi:hypothetical protein